MQYFGTEKTLTEHKKNCLIINGKQSVKLKSGSISFKNYFKQLPVPFNIYADIECILKRVRGSHKNNGSYTEKYIKTRSLAVLLIKLHVLIINSVKKLFYREEKMLFIGSLKNDYCKKNDKKGF